MPIELEMLAWSVALGLLHVLLGAALTTLPRGTAIELFFQMQHAHLFVDDEAGASLLA